jgi:hypothetical protein
MLFGGSLSARRTGSRADGADEFLGVDLEQRLPTSAHGSSLLATERLAALGVRPGRYAGVEQVYAAPSAMAAALEPTSCEVTRDGSLVMTSAASGEVTTFAWVMDRWRWSPLSGVSVEAVPRRVGAVLVIDFLACEGRASRPAGRCYLGDVRPSGEPSDTSQSIARR